MDIYSRNDSKQYLSAHFTEQEAGHETFKIGSGDKRFCSGRVLSECGRSRGAGAEAPCPGLPKRLEAVASVAVLPGQPLNVTHSLLSSLHASR